MSTIDTVKSFYSALAAGDVAALAGLFGEDLAWTEAEGFPYYSGTWRSFGEIAEKLLVPVGRDWEGFAATPTEFLPTEDGRIVTIGVYSGTFRATGKTMRAAFAHVWRVRDGHIVQFDMHTDTLLVARAMR